MPLQLWEAACFEAKDHNLRFGSAKFQEDKLLIASSTRLLLLHSTQRGSADAAAYMQRLLRPSRMPPDAELLGIQTMEVAADDSGRRRTLVCLALLLPPAETSRNAATSNEQEEAATAAAQARFRGSAAGTRPQQRSHHHFPDEVLDKPQLPRPVLQIYGGSCDPGVTIDSILEDCQQLELPCVPLAMCSAPVWRVLPPPSANNAPAAPITRGSSGSHAANANDGGGNGGGNIGGGGGSSGSGGSGSSSGGGSSGSSGSGGGVGGGSGVRGGSGGNGDVGGRDSGGGSAGSANGSKTAAAASGTVTDSSPARRSSIEANSSNGNTNGVDDTALVVSSGDGKLHVFVRPPGDSSIGGPSMLAERPESSRGGRRQLLPELADLGAAACCLSVRQCGETRLVAVGTVDGLVRLSETSYRRRMPAVTAAEARFEGPIAAVEWLAPDVRGGGRLAVFVTCLGFVVVCRLTSGGGGVESGDGEQMQRPRLLGQVARLGSFRPEDSVVCSGLCGARNLLVGTYFGRLGVWDVGEAATAVAASAPKAAGATVAEPLAEGDTKASESAMAPGEGTRTDPAVGEDTMAGAMATAGLVAAAAAAAAREVTTAAVAAATSAIMAAAATAATRPPAAWRELGESFFEPDFDPLLAIGASPAKSGASDFLQDEEAGQGQYLGVEETTLAAAAAATVASANDAAARALAEGALPLWSRRLPHPACAVVSLDMDRDGREEAIAITQHGVHVLYRDPFADAAKVSAALDALLGR